MRTSKEAEAEPRGRGKGHKADIKCGEPALNWDCDTTMESQISPRNGRDYSVCYQVVGKRVRSMCYVVDW